MPHLHERTILEARANSERFFYVRRYGKAAVKPGATSLLSTSP